MEGRQQSLMFLTQKPNAVFEEANSSFRLRLAAVSPAPLTDFCLLAESRQLSVDNGGGGRCIREAFQPVLELQRLQRRRTLYLHQKRWEIKRKLRIRVFKK